MFQKDVKSIRLISGYKVIDHRTEFQKDAKSLRLIKNRYDYLF